MVANDVLKWKGCKYELLVHETVIPTLKRYFQVKKGRVSTIYKYICMYHIYTFLALHNNKNAYVTLVDILYMPM